MKNVLWIYKEFPQILYDYTCRYCRKTYQYKQSYQRHLRYQCGGNFGKFLCWLCDHRCNYKSNLKSHLECKHKLVLLFARNVEMPITKKGTLISIPSFTVEIDVLDAAQLLLYTYRKGLLQHKKYQCGREPQFCCPMLDCNYKSHFNIFATISVILETNLHILVIYYILGEVILCGLNILVRNKYVYMQLIGYSYFDFSERHVCHKYFRTYKWKRNLQQHRTRECGVEPRFYCPYSPTCHYRSNIKGNVTKHVRNIHNILYYVLDNRHHCPNCDKSYKWKQGLSQHMRYECGKEPQFACPYAPTCRYRSKVKSNIKYHVKNFSFDLLHRRLYYVLELSYRCPTCNRRYMLRRRLDQHIEFQCGKEPQFICPYAPSCIFRAYINGDLKKHVFWKHEGGLLVQPARALTSTRRDWQNI
nr:unnamed protein product [Callosobruchus analis]